MTAFGPGDALWEKKVEDRRPPSAYSLLPTAFEGCPSWRASWPIPQPRTRCHLPQRKKNP
jgi:hypothetical protein